MRFFSPVHNVKPECLGAYNSLEWVKKLELIDWFYQTQVMMLHPLGSLFQVTGWLIVTDSCLFLRSWLSGLRYRADSTRIRSIRARWSAAGTPGMESRTKLVSSRTLTKFRDRQWCFRWTLRTLSGRQQPSHSATVTSAARFISAPLEIQRRLPRLDPVSGEAQR